MVKRFRHKGLERFFSTGSKQGIRPEHAGRLKDILLRLHFSAKAQERQSCRILVGLGKR